MKDADTIIRELGSLNLSTVRALEYVQSTPQETRLIEQIHGLVLAARTAAPGPVTRPAAKAENADDYLAVVQIALAVGYDGQLHTSHRHDAPKHAVIPLAAALRHLVDTIERELRKQVNLTAAELDRFCEPIVQGLVGQDFAAIRLEIERDSRTEQEPKLVVPD